MLIEGHPSMELVFASANGQRGQTMRVGQRNTTFVSADDAPLGDASLVFSALPHGASLEWVDRARNAGAKVVDLSSDLRIGNSHSNGHTDVPYGLTEIRRKEVVGADLVSNPGCYPTAILLALAPLVEDGLIDAGSTISVSAASGVTGAGYTPRPDLLFAEVSEDFRAYGIGNGHRHVAEMQAMLQELGGDQDLVFTPHLLPVARGILATIVVRLARELASPLDPWRQAYGNEPFIELSETTPALRDVVRRNVVKISAANAANTKRPTLIITSAIDNLTKGAAGQALQNANLMLGFEETTGLPL
jgi:N-acetyl-gamma-glutamyl-phosphate reductase